MVQQLTVAAVRDHLVRELERLDFALVKGRQLKLVREINQETEVFLYPGVRRDRGLIVVDPVIGVENRILRDRLLVLDAEHWSGHTRVCHFYLGLIDDWAPLYLQATEQLDAAASTFTRYVVDHGLPMMREFDTLGKVRQLLRDPWAPDRPPVAVLFEKEKLAVLQEN